jgi:hypothetical protein
MKRLLVILVTLSLLGTSVPPPSFALLGPQRIAVPNETLQTQALAEGVVNAAPIITDTPRIREVWDYKFLRHRIPVLYPADDARTRDDYAHFTARELRSTLFGRALPEGLHDWLREILAAPQSNAEMVEAAVELFHRYSSKTLKWIKDAIGHPAVSARSLSAIADFIQSECLFDSSQMTPEVLQWIDLLLKHPRAEEATHHGAVMSLYLIAAQNRNPLSGQAKTLLEQLPIEHPAYPATQRAVGLLFGSRARRRLKMPPITHLYFEDDIDDAEAPYVSAIQSHALSLRPRAKEIMGGEETTFNKIIQRVDGMHVGSCYLSGDSPAHRQGWTTAANPSSQRKTGHCFELLNRRQKNVGFPRYESPCA